jgi:hypothetical protein
MASEHFSPELYVFAGVISGIFIAFFIDFILTKAPKYLHICTPIHYWSCTDFSKCPSKSTRYSRCACGKEFYE